VNKEKLKAGALFVWDELNRVHPWLGRFVLYSLLALLVFAGHKQYQRLREATSIEHDADGVQTYAGDLGGRNLEVRLRETGASRKDVNGLLKAIAKYGGQSRAYPGDGYEITLSTGDEFLHLTILRGLKRIVVLPKGDGFEAKVFDVPIIQTRRDARGGVRSNLWLSMQSAGVPPTIIQEFADIFQWQVDFLTETHDGDRFAVAWVEKHSPDGRSWGRTVEAGVYDGRAAGRNVGVLFNDGYYDEKGKSLQSMFLKAPLSYRRISSYFSSSRYHPILRYRRPHNGTDYAAPYGTPVSTIGNGVVTRSGYRGGLGNAVEIRHASGYLTIYGHMKGFAKGIFPGAHVRQGQVIGYVGSTGISSGPHLHFQISKGGQWLDFLRIKTPRDRSVPAAKAPEFNALRDRYLQLFGALPPGAPPPSPAAKSKT
jgi:murein DD-endopeptidase MepM/ murein hydrolase activator NlpD